MPQKFQPLLSGTSASPAQLVQLLELLKCVKLVSFVVANIKVWHWASLAESSFPGTGRFSKQFLHRLQVINQISTGLHRGVLFRKELCRVHKFSGISMQGYISFRLSRRLFSWSVATAKKSRAQPEGRRGDFAQDVGPVHSVCFSLFLQKARFSSMAACAGIVSVPADHRGYRRHLRSIWR